MKRERNRLIIALAAPLAVLLLLVGCGQYQSGEPFQEPLENYQDQSTPLAAVQKLLMSMEWKDRDPGKGRDFEAFKEVAALALFPDGVQPDEQVMKELEEKWNSREWEVEFKELRLEVDPPEAEDPGWEGSEARVRIVDGLVRYIGKEMFDTTEIKVESFKDKPGEFILRKRGERWMVVGGRMVGNGEHWEARQ